MATRRLSIGSGEEDREIDDMLDYLKPEHGASLSSWEQEFVESITEQWERRGSLSDTQIDKLRQIYDEK